MERKQRLGSSVSSWDGAHSEAQAPAQALLVQDGSTTMSIMAGGGHMGTGTQEGQGLGRYGSAGRALEGDPHAHEFVAEAEYEALQLRARAQAVKLSLLGAEKAFTQQLDALVSSVPTAAAVEDMRRKLAAAHEELDREKRRNHSQKQELLLLKVRAGAVPPAAMCHHGAVADVCACLVVWGTQEEAQTLTRQTEVLAHQAGLLGERASVSTQAMREQAAAQAHQLAKATRTNEALQGVVTKADAARKKLEEECEARAGRVQELEENVAQLKQTVFNLRRYV